MKGLSMKKLLILLTLFFGVFFSLTACDSAEIPNDEIIKEDVLNPTDNDDVENPVAVIDSYDIVYYYAQDNKFLTQHVNEGELTVEPNQPVKDMFIFEYWTLNSVEFSFDTIIDRDIELHAKWKSEILTISLYSDETILDSIDVKNSSTFNALPNFVEDGSDQVFRGWFLDKELTVKFNSSLPVVDNLNLYGKWETIVIVDPIIVDPIGDLEITEDGLYTSKDEVALYIATYHKLPSNYMTKAEANGDIRNIYSTTNKASIGGDVFGNREGLLPSGFGITFTELDIDYNGGSRGAKRIVYSSDFRIFYTDDHYDSFVEYDKETREWKSY